jgi:hypothetical protein
MESAADPSVTLSHMEMTGEYHVEKDGTGDEGVSELCFSIALSEDGGDFIQTPAILSSNTPTPTTNLLPFG